MGTRETTDRTGRLIADRFRVTDVIARGGMAVVYRARDERLGRDVAVKVVDLRSDLDGRSQQRIDLEAQRAASLRHPNIVSVHDAGRDGEQAFIVMELVDGETLTDYLERHGPLEEHQAADIAARVCDALSAAHRRGIVHRDIKPSNILIDDDGRVRVTDFGIARANEGDTVTEVNPMGSAPYIAPEQLAGGEVDGRADLFALGVVLYEAVTGRLPFVGDTATSTAWRRLHHQPDPPGDSAHLPRGLGAVIERALATEPDDRYTTAADMRTDLERILRAREHDTITMAAMEAADDGRSRRRRRFALALVPLLAVIGGIALLTSTLFDARGEADVTTVPDVTGISLDAAERLLELRDLQSGTVRYVRAQSPSGTVLEQSPGPEADATPGATVDLTVSRGPTNVDTSPSPSPSDDGERDAATTTGRTDDPADTAEEPAEDRAEEPADRGGGPPDVPPGQGDEPPGQGDPPGNGRGR